MSTFSLIHKRATRLLCVLGMSFVLLFPLAACAGTATIDASALESSSAKPVLVGTATDVTSIKIRLYKEGGTKIVYKSRAIKVRGETWKTRVSKRLPSGTYDVTISSTKGGSRGVISTQRLIIDTKKERATYSGTLALAPIPLLVGGTAYSGASVPIAYLQITNIGKESVLLSGFWVKQNGTAPAHAIVGLSTVDDRGGSRGFASGDGAAPLFKNGVAFAPTAALFVPGQMRLFTIRAQLGSDTLPFIGQQLMIDVTGIEGARVQGVLPVRGTTWTISN